MIQGEGEAAGFGRWIYDDLTLLLCCESDYMYLQTGIINSMGVCKRRRLFQVVDGRKKGQSMIRLDIE
jgi:hypothetical protein